MQSVLFDFGGTLDGDGVSWIDRFYPLYKEEGLEIPRARFARAFYDSDDNLPARFALQGLSLEKTVALQVSCVLEGLVDHVSSKRAAGLGERVAARFVEDCRRHFRRNLPVLEKLRGRYRLGIVSNFYGNLESVLESEGLRPLFDAVADSGTVGVEKPEAGIFLHALGALKSRPSDCLMVGDSIPRDMRGAEGLRMAHALLGAASEAPCCPRALTLKTLLELEPLLS